MHKSRLAGFIIDCQTQDLDAATSAPQRDTARRVQIQILPHGAIKTRFGDKHAGVSFDRCFFIDEHVARKPIKIPSDSSAHLDESTGSQDAAADIAIDFSAPGREPRPAVP